MRRAAPARQRPLATSALAAASLLTGIALLALALTAPDHWLRTRGWTQQEALRHQQATAELHELTLRDPSDPVVVRRLREARQEFAEVDSALERATRSSERLRARMAQAGAVLCVLGLVFMLVRRSRGGS